MVTIEVPLIAPPPRWTIRKIRFQSEPKKRRRRQTILVVEDEQLQRYTTWETLKKQRFAVKVAVTEKQLDRLVAVKKIDLSRIDLAIIDIHLGGIGSMDYRGLKRARKLARTHRVIIRSSPSLKQLQDSSETPEDLKLWLNKLPPWVSYVAKYEADLLVPRIRELLRVEVRNLPEPEPDRDAKQEPPTPSTGAVQLSHLTIVFCVLLVFGLVAVLVGEISWLIGSVMSAMAAVPLLREERLPKTISGWGSVLREHMPLLALLSAYGSVLLALTAREVAWLVMAGVLTLVSPFSVIFVKGLEFSDRRIANNPRKQMRMYLSFAGGIISQLLLLGTGLITLATADFRWFIGTLWTAVLALLFLGVCVEWLEETIDEFYQRAWDKLATNRKSQYTER